MAVPGEFSGTGAKSRTRGAFLGHHRSMVCTTDPVPEADKIRRDSGRRAARWSRSTAVERPFAGRRRCRCCEIVDRDSAKWNHHTHRRAGPGAVSNSNLRS